MHERGMYFFFDLTITTMGNLIVPKEWVAEIPSCPNAPVGRPRLTRWQPSAAT